MQVPPDHNRHMAMLKAALPYAMPESRRAIEIMLQADALIHTARGQSDERYSLEAAGLSLEDQPSAPDFTPNPETCCNVFVSTVLQKKLILSRLS